MSYPAQTGWPPGIMWRQVLIAGVMLGVWVVVNQGCKHWAATRARQAHAEAAAPFLEAANATRRQIGLWPVTATLSLRDYDGDSVAHLLMKPDIVPCRYCPYVSSKHVLYVPDTQQLKWELETIVLTPMYPINNRYPKYLLSREYSYTDATRGRNPWNIKLIDQSSNDVTRFPLTLAQADSVLTYWRNQGIRDSLAALAAKP